MKLTRKWKDCAEDSYADDLGIDVSSLTEEQKKRLMKI